MNAVVVERWREERRSRILQAAARVFSRDTFHDASMDSIAQEAGVGKPTLYRYFAGKDALFAAVFIQALDQLEAGLDRALEIEDGIEVQLTALITEIVPMFRDHLVSLRLLGDTAAAADQSRRRIFRERRARIGSYLARAIDAGVRRGELRPIDGTRTAQLMIGMIWSATAATDGSDTGIAGDIADLVLNGLMRRDGSRTGKPLSDTIRTTSPSPGDESSRQQALV